MKRKIFTLIAFMTAFAFGCSKNSNSIDYNNIDTDRLKVVFYTKFGTTTDTTFLTLQSKYAINPRNYQSSIMYTQVDKNNANVKILTSTGSQSFNFNWYLKDDAIANFNLYKKATVDSTVYGKN